MGLKDYTGDDIYAHTGVITDKSTCGFRLEICDRCLGHVNNPKVKMTKVSANVYTLTISPSISEFYGVPSADIIMKLAFVFRSY